MIRYYNIYSEDIFDDKYAVWKMVIRTNFKAPIVNKDLLFEYHFCTIVDLYSEKDGNRYGNFKDYEDYKDFLKRDLEDFDTQGPDTYMWSGYARKLDQVELDFFMKDYHKQNGYLYSKVFDFETREELPPYYFLLVNYNDYYATTDSPFKDYEIPYDRNDIVSLYLENHYNKLVKSYEHDGIMKFNYPYKSVYDDLQKMLVCHLKNEKFDIKRFQEIYKNIFKIKDKGVAKYLLYIFTSFYKKEIESKKEFKMCEICGKLFDFNQDKKYCSEKCKTKAKNKRYYEKNASKIKMKNIK